MPEPLPVKFGRLTGDPAYASKRGPHDALLDAAEDRLRLISEVLAEEGWSTKLVMQGTPRGASVSLVVEIVATRDA